MIDSLVLKKSAIKTKTLTIIIAVAIAVTLPQIFHIAGAASGVSSNLGETFLPMHLPVFLAGLLAGPLVGTAAGILSPVISFALSGMPGAIMLPYILIELAIYGFVSGLLCKTKMPMFCKVILAQIAGRILRIAAILIAAYGFGSQAVTLDQTWSIIQTGLLGILLQWALIPLIMYRIQGLKKYYD